MYIRLNQYFVNFDNYKAIDFEEGNIPGTIDVELTNLDDSKEELAICFDADPEDKEFNHIVRNTIIEEFYAALNEGQRAFDLSAYHDRFE